MVNFAAESHVDRSIMGSGPSSRPTSSAHRSSTSPRPTRKVPPGQHRRGVRFAPEDRPEIKFTEETPLAPNSPYASKAAADCLVRSYYHTFKMPVLTTRCSNNYGPYQFPEKLIPLFVTNLMEGRKVPLYGDGMNVRDWLYVDDHCDAVWTVFPQQGSPARSTTSAATTSCPTGRSPTQSCGDGKGLGRVRRVRQGLPGHDRRYAIDASKIQRELGWQPKHRFDEAIKTTIRWYRQNEPWWRAIRNKEYLKYYEQQYANR